MMKGKNSKTRICSSASFSFSLSCGTDFFQPSTMEISSRADDVPFRLLTAERIDVLVHDPHWQLLAHTDYLRVPAGSLGRLGKSHFLQ
jgi:hypothetical protein